MSKENMEMSKLDKKLPKHYKGYDLDIILEKMDNNETLTENENVVIWEAMKLFYDKDRKRHQKEVEEIIKKNKAAGIIAGARTHCSSLEGLSLYDNK